MNNYYHLLVLFFLLLIFSSCEKDVELNFNHLPTLCLNCVLNPDSTITASLTEAREIENSNIFEPVENAQIKLIEDGVILGEIQSIGNGKYKLNYKPKPHKKYEIIVSHPNFPVLTATTIVPEFSVIEWKVDTIEKVKYESFFIVDVEYEIHDKIGVNSYWFYTVGIIKSGEKVSGVGYEINAPFIDDFNRQIDIEAKYGFVYYYYVRMSDEGYDGKILRFSSMNGTRATDNILSADEHYDKYIKSSVKAQLNTEGELPFREPVQIYSNIKNGYGIFGSCAITSIKL